MSWVGLREGARGQFCPQGLGRPAPSTPADPDALLPRGTLMLAFEVDPMQQGDLIRLDTHQPWPCGLMLGLGPRGSVHLTQWQGNQIVTAALPTDLGAVRESTVISYSWDAPTRIGTLSLWLPDRRQLFQADVIGPLPLSYRMAAALMTLPDGCPLAPGVSFLALSDRVEPAGPTATIDGAAPVATPRGVVPMGRLQPGEVVLTGDGDIAQVRWAGWQDLPARGPFAPLVLRAPYYGARENVTIAPCQRLVLRGSGVEYLFARDRVGAAARHLRHDRAIVPAPPVLVKRWHQVLLDRPASLMLAGVEMEGLDAAPLLANPGTWGSSLLAGMPNEWRPRGRFQDTTLRILNNTEAVTLAMSGVA
ncbi:Hint domain-containing protein [Limimaricola sp.]|uniref:Hint domain-containing protein n=1 Tax=Limimaricola sp. TaxID=2211665 RepID=UPI0025C2FDD4|nr:Hint domain-containing protein [Limimaricola sp.]